MEIENLDYKTDRREFCRDISLLTLGVVLIKLDEVKIFQKEDSLNGNGGNVGMSIISPSYGFSNRGGYI